MKKIYLGIISMFICCCANAATMCISSDNITVVLDPSINGTTYTKDEAAKTWNTTFSYGKIYGIASCNETNGGSMGNTTTEEFSQSDEGKYCWCKMVSPAVSLWTFDYANSSASDCAGDCARDCGISARNDAALRGGLFGSVAK